MGFQVFVWKDIKEVDGLALVPKGKVKMSITYFCKLYTKNPDVLGMLGYCGQEEHIEKYFKEYSKRKVTE